MYQQQECCQRRFQNVQGKVDVEALILLHCSSSCSSRLATLLLPALALLERALEQEVLLLRQSDTWYPNGWMFAVLSCGPEGFTIELLLLPSDISVENILKRSIRFVPVNGTL